MLDGLTATKSSWSIARSAGWCLCALLWVACSSDAETNRQPRDASPVADAGDGGGGPEPKTDAHIPDGPDAATDPVQDAGIDAGDAAGPPTPDGGGCVPNPSGDDPDCAEICPETCNDRDDDCDGRVDEGSAGDACAADFAVAACVAGQCVIAACEPGHRDCDGEAANGCEAGDDDVEHCGGCGNRCDFGNAIAMCIDGTCQRGGCKGGFTDCDGILPDCETDIGNDPMHCGGCTTVCALTSATPNASGVGCTEGVCFADCDDGFDDCNGDYADGCETPLNTSTDCGGCGVECPGDCSSGTCDPAYCPPDFGDCDLDGDSCETPLDTNDNCGACGNSCDGLTAAIAGCGGDVGARSCQISSCTGEGSRDCDGEAMTGCEVDVRDDVAHCGACHFDCRVQDNVASATCDASDCTFTCEPGFDDCNDVIVDGCETPLNNLQHCGACATPCARANGSASCVTGDCELADCDEGFENCDGDEDNGCEPLNTLDDCGSCGAPCVVANGTPTCASGSCEVSSCMDDWRDCDGSPDNGCEHDGRPIADDGLGPCHPDSTCTKLQYDGRSYYFCQDNRSWMTASNNCQLLLDTQLVQIDDQNEQDFVFANLVADAWIGGPVNCVRMSASDGTTSGDTCGLGFDYVCEQNADLCPADPAKDEPGLCGCGVADDDGDTDGTPDCVDACPTDPDKTAPGVCGCNMADSDSDGDGSPDCTDECPSNPAKTIAPCTWEPSNFAPAMYPHTRDVAFDCGETHTFDATAGSWDTTCCGLCPEVTANPVDQTVAGGPQVVILSMRNLHVASTDTIRVIGDYPVIFSVILDASIEGVIDAGALATLPGAGGNQSCAMGTGGNGEGGIRGAGGGGGGFGTAGSQGGGNGCWGIPDPGAGGSVHGSAALSPLMGGCAGGTGGGSGALGGGGGGALQLAAQRTLTVAAGAVISAAGGGGIRGTTPSGGGGGGGSGGAVLLEYGAQVLLDGVLRVHGGGGGEAELAVSDGENGHLVDDMAALGGMGGDGPDGGNGATRCVSNAAACTAADVASMPGTMVFSVACLGNGGSGGGGGAGRAVVTAK
jgi:hypothetical protein